VLQGDEVTAAEWFDLLLTRAYDEPFDVLDF
jgi:hypothetical protein